MRKNLSLTIVFLLMKATCALSEDAANQQPNLDQVKAFAEASMAAPNLAMTDPSLTSPLRFPKLQARVLVTQSDSNAALEINLNPRDEGISDFHAGLKISGPVSKTTKQASLASFDGLADQAAASLNISWLYPNPETAFLTGDNFSNALIAEYKAERLAVDLEQGLSMDELSAEGQNNVLSRIGLSHGLFLFGGEGTYEAPKTFAFSDPKTLAKAEERHDGYRVSANFGWLPLRQNSPYFLGLSYKRIEEYGAQDPQQVCSPLGVGNALGCSDLVLGAPTKQVTNIAQMEMRIYAQGGQLAFNPRVSRDFTNGVTGVDLPIYFMKDADGTLNGGINLGWRSDKRQVVLSAFLGTMSLKNPFSAQN